MNIDDSVRKSLLANRWIIIILIILLIIFVLLTAGFVFFPLNNIRNEVDEINRESIEAFTTLQNTSTDVETTIKTIEAVAARANQVEDNVLAFIKAACNIPFPPFFATQFCMNLNSN